MKYFVFNEFENIYTDDFQEAKKHLEIVRNRGNGLEILTNIGSFD